MCHSLIPWHIVHNCTSSCIILFFNWASSVLIEKVLLVHANSFPCTHIHIASHRPQLSCNWGVLNISGMCGSDIHLFFKWWLISCNLRPYTCGTFCLCLFIILDFQILTIHRHCLLGWCGRIKCGSSLSYFSLSNPPPSTHLKLYNKPPILLISSDLHESQRHGRITWNADGTTLFSRWRRHSLSESNCQEEEHGMTWGDHDNALEKQ